MKNKRPSKEALEYFATMGAKGGSAVTGEKKVRGNSEYYRKLRAKRPKGKRS